MMFADEPYDDELDDLEDQCAQYFARYDQITKIAFRDKIDVPELDIMPPDFVELIVSTASEIEEALIECSEIAKG
jgi:hypothetical protein